MIRRENKNKRFSDLKFKNMNIREFTKDIFYVGVNDRTTHLFEALWPLPYGVSYNSYIVAGTEKTALIDTVRIDEVHAYIDAIESVGRNARIDYLVVNHMEPDHSGSIPEIIKYYPGIKIIGNSKTIDMIKGFYHIDDPDRFLEVKDGDTISLGDHTLKFYFTPMVHWPETMMTYVEDLGVLFSGDAFGTFGALNGGITDRDMDTDIHISEMYRYYSNIVGKYGRFVGKALEKLSGLTLNYICSTHGPVWIDRKNEVVKIVSDLASYKSEPGVTIVYGSMYGNTAEVVESVARELTSLGIRNIRIHNASVSPMSDMITDAFRYKTLIVASATYSMRLFPPVETFMNAMETREIKDKIFAVIGNYTWAKNVVADKMKEYADRMKLEITAALTVKQSPDTEDENAAGEFARQLVNAMEVVETDK